MARGLKVPPISLQQIRKRYSSLILILKMADAKALLRQAQKQKRIEHPLAKYPFIIFLLYSATGY